jgi:glyoxylate/hydroxypyruvate reductase A
MAALAKPGAGDNTQMKIAFCSANTRAQPWIDGLRAALPQAEIVEWAPGGLRDAAGRGLADYAVVWAPPQQLLDEQPQMKALFNIGAGVDAVLKLDLPPAMQLVRLDDAGMSVQMAEFVTHAVIRHFRELDAYQDDIAQGKWSYRKPPVRADFPVGVMGLGVLGERVAQALRTFDFPVLGWSRTAKRINGVTCYAGESQFDEFLAATRVLVCLLPLTPDTRDVMNRRALSLLKPGGYVINVARGAHLVDNDLLELIDSGHLAGAALDVFREEPLPATHPFWRHPRITVTPHTSARTLRDEAVAQIAGKMLAMARGEPVAGVVDRKRGY